MTLTSPYPFTPTLATCTDIDELVPGSVDGLHGDAEHLETQARSLATHADDLRNLAPETWTGGAANGWATTRGALAEALRTVSEAHSTAAAVLRAHAAAITAARARAAVAVGLYRRGCDLSRAAGLVVPVFAVAGDAADPGASHREAGEAVLRAAQRDAAASGRAAGAVLDELDAGIPDGRWHTDDFMTGLGSWAAGLASTLWKLSSVRMLVDDGGYARDVQEQVDGLRVLWDATMADPIGAGELLVDLQGLQDRPAQWWGQLMPDVALALVGGTGAGMKTLGLAAWTDEIGAASGAAGSNAPRVFASADPDLAEAANAIEAALPGRVVSINNLRLMTNGRAREVDIDLGNLIVQVKSGNARRLTAQIGETRSTTGVRTVGYAETIPDGAWANAARQGIPILRSPEELVAYVKEFG